MINARLFALTFAIMASSAIAQTIPPVPAFIVKMRAEKVKNSRMIVALDHSLPISRELKAAVEENWDFSSYRFGVMDSVLEYLTDPANSVLCNAYLTDSQGQNKRNILGVFMGNRKVSSLEYADMVTYLAISYRPNGTEFSKGESPLFSRFYIMLLQTQLENVYTGHAPKQKRDKQYGCYYYDNGQQLLAQKDIYILHGSVPEDRLPVYASNFMLPAERFTFIDEKEMVMRMKRKDENAAYVIWGHAVYDYRGRMLAIGSIATPAQGKAYRKRENRYITFAVGGTLLVVGSFALLINLLND